MISTAPPSFVRLVYTAVKLLPVLALLFAAQHALPVGQNVLVIGDNVKDSHSKLLSSLNAINTKITYKTTESKDVSLRVDGEFVYSALILLCPDANLRERLPLSTILRFIDSGNSLFVAAADHFSSYTKLVVESIGVDIDENGNAMRDHQNVFKPLDSGDHTYIHAGGMVKSEYLFGDTSISPKKIIFRGAGATIFSDNELTDNILWGSPSSYSGNGKRVTKIPRAAGHASVLAAALSTRSGSRATYFGSLHTLSNEAMEQAGEAHEQAMKSLLAWALGARGNLRIGNVRYVCFDDDGIEQNECRVKDNLEFAMDIEKFNAYSNTWTPFETDDMQLEFIMMNPWVRTRLKSSSNGTFEAKIRIPDQIGVYKLSVQYFRAGVSPIMMEKVVAVRPYMHNEYERFISMAAPYYAACFSLIVGVILLGIVLVTSSEEKHEKKQ